MNEFDKKLVISYYDQVGRNTILKESEVCIFKQLLNEGMKHEQYLE